MIKPIKFDLKLNNGTSLATLDDLEENLSPELFQHFYSGKLAKWLRVRKLDEQADAVEKLLTEIHDREVQSFKGLIELFGGEADVDSLRTAITERKKASSSIQNSDDEEIQQLKAENKVLKKEIEEKKQNLPQIKKYQVNQELLNKLYQQENTYIKGRIPQFKLKTVQASFNEKLKELSIERDDILAVYVEFTSSAPYKIRDFWCLTPDFFYSKFLSLSENNMKIILKDIYYVYFEKDESYRKSDNVLIINHTMCKSGVLRNNQPLIDFLTDYLGLKSKKPNETQTASTVLAGYYTRNTLSNFFFDLGKKT
ncbi:MAG: hypothetical protein PHN45_08695 [Methylococcales bacterium]|nr:hypothetical protein [Methylococcales bacterium]MDD5754814.1 hypothetical protein [Methylococcales bacterium]